MKRKEFISYANVERNGEKWTITITRGKFEDCKKAIESFIKHYENTDINITSTYIV